MTRDRRSHVMTRDSFSHAIPDESDIEIQLGKWSLRHGRDHSAETNERGRV
jgi:hypothetical protein